MSTPPQSNKQTKNRKKERNDKSIKIKQTKKKQLTILRAQNNNNYKTETTTKKHTQK